MVVSAALLVEQDVAVFAAAVAVEDHSHLPREALSDSLLLLS